MTDKPELPPERIKVDFRGDSPFFAIEEWKCQHGEALDWPVYIRADAIPTPLGAAWMREQALKAIDPGFGDFHAGDYNAIRAIPMPTEADILAAAMELPQIKALVDAAGGLVNSPNYDARTMAPLFRALAALKGPTR